MWAASTLLRCSTSFRCSRPFSFAPKVSLLRKVLPGGLKTITRGTVLGTPLTEGISSRAQKTVGYWLLGCSGMVFGAVVLGGVTRLTESGLSIVDWHLIKGMRPPLTDADWHLEFDKYKNYPEYHYKTGSREMSLSEFKFIWSMEYLHRMWGRAIGLAYFIPAALFWRWGWITKPMKSRVGIAGGLLLFQGLLGWYMVKSGLDPSQNSDQQMPRVSQYRLAAHLSSAFVLYTILLWCGLSHVLKPVDHGHIRGVKMLRGFAHMSKTTMFLTAVVGAFVAGLDAGLVYNSWPKFADRWVPTDLWSKSPTWKNFTENPTMVQFIHRGLAYATLAAVTTTWFIGCRMALPRRTKMVLHSLMGMAYVQAGLGIFTLIQYVPVWLGALHQSGSLVLLTFAFWLTNELKRFHIRK